MTNPAASTLDDAILAPEPIAIQPQRRIMIGLILALAVLLHVATVGWGPIENGSEGLNAAVAREMAMGLSHSEISSLWGEQISPNPVHFLLEGSFKLFGISEASARIPAGIANFLIIWMVYLIGEKMGGMWRGLSSALIAATCMGVVLQGRSDCAASITGLLMMSVFYASLKMLEQCSRIRWQVVFWIFEMALWGIGEPVAVWIGIAGPLMAMTTFREARIRLRWKWFVAVGILFLVAIWISKHNDTPSIQSWGHIEIASFVGLFFPWSAIVVLPLIFQFKRVLRVRACGLDEIVFGTLIILTGIWCRLSETGGKWTIASCCWWPLFALLAGLIWERATSGLRILGIGVVVICSLIGVAFLPKFAGVEWTTSLRPIWWMSCGVLIIFCVAAIVSVKLRHSRTALLTLSAAVIPLAFNLVDAKSRLDWQSSLKHLSQKLTGEYQPEARVFVDSSSMARISGFLFYAPHGVKFVRSTTEIRPALGDYVLSSKRDNGSIQILGTAGNFTLVRK